MHLAFPKNRVILRRLRRTLAKTLITRGFIEASCAVVNGWEGS